MSASLLKRGLLELLTGTHAQPILSCIGGPVSPSGFVKLLHDDLIGSWGKLKD